MSMHLQVIVVVGFLVFPHANARACTLVNREVADGAVEIIQRAVAVVTDDWFNRQRVDSVRWVREGFLYSVELNGEIQLNLSNSYVITEESDQLQSLGWIFSDYCGVPDSPRLIPATPMSPTAQALDPPQSSERVEPIIGILEVSGLLGSFSEGLWEGPSGDSIAIYAQPSTVGKISARIPDTSRVKKLEYGYESLGVVTLERTRDWFRVQLEPAGTGWIQPSDHQTFHPLENLLRNGLTYLTAAWDGVIYESPTHTSTKSAIQATWRQRLGAEISVETLESRKIDGELWFRIDLLQESMCSGSEPQAFASGWVPAHSPSGQATIWFWSRGC
jgi:hypothetical protein